MSSSASWRRAAWGAVVVLAAIGVAVALRRMAALAPVLAGLPAPAGGPAQLAALDAIFADAPLLTMAHIVPGALFMVLGPLQLSAAVRRRAPGWHRWAGRAFVLCGAIVGATAIAMSLAMPAIGGPLQAAATLTFGALFLYELWRAYTHIRRREVARHREWMLRAFAVGLAVATVRPIVGACFATARLTGLTPAQFFGPAFWAGFLIHAAAAELWLRRPRARRPDLV